MGQRPHCVQTNGQTRHMPPSCFAYAPAHPHLGSSFNFLVLACQPADLRRRPPACPRLPQQPANARRTTVRLVSGSPCPPADPRPPLRTRSPARSAAVRCLHPPPAARLCWPRLCPLAVRSASARRLPALSARAAGAMGSRRRGPSAPAMPAGLQQQGTCRSAWPVSRPAPVRRGAASPSLCDGQLAPAQAARPPAASLCCPICARPPAAASARCQLPAG